MGGAVLGIPRGDAQPKREFSRRERTARKEDFSMCSMRSMWLKDDLTTENAKAAKKM
jgi:hypothetical protein